MSAAAPTALIHLLPDELIIKITRESIREIIVMVCKRWRGLEGELECESVANDPYAYLRPELYSWFRPEFWDFDTSVKLGNWEASIHAFYEDHREITPDDVRKVFLDMISDDSDIMMSDMIAAFPSRVPQLSISDLSAASTICRNTPTRSTSCTKRVI